MIPLLLLGGIALVGVAIGAYWKNIAKWIERIWAKLPASIKQDLQGAVALVQKIASVFKNVMKYYAYSNQTKKWSETVVTSEVSENEIPEHIRRNMENSSSNQVDISAEIQEKLELSL